LSGEGFDQQHAVVRAQHQHLTVMILCQLVIVLDATNVNVAPSQAAVWANSQDLRKFRTVFAPELAISCTTYVGSFNQHSRGASSRERR
jgi:hypothetical protein